MPISGLARSFIDQASQEGGIRSGDEYFNGLMNNLLTLARAHGVELFNEDLGRYHVLQPVIDDVLSASAVQNKRRKARGLADKSYEQVRHDVVLWHFVHDKREVYVDSPLRAKYWIVTVDYSLLGFDAYKTQQPAHDVPLCLHPTTLVNMLRFWLPRGEDLDAAIVRSLRLPFLFLNYDPALEKATLQILRAVSRFESADLLSAETITQLVTDDALRRRMQATSDPELEVELIKTELIAQEEELRIKLAESTARAQELESIVGSRQAELVALNERLERTERGGEANAEGRKAAEKRASAAEHSAARVRVGFFLVAAAVVGALPIAAGISIAWVLGPTRARTLTVSMGALLWISVSLLLTLLLVHRWGSETEKRIVQKLARANRGLWVTVILVFLAGLLTNFVFGSLTSPARHPPSPTPSPSATRSP